MKNAIRRPSSKSTAEINCYQFLNKYFFLLFGITYLSIITITATNWSSFCSQNSYFGESASSNSLDNAALVLDQPKFSTWFYAFMLLGCSATPWLLAYMFRHKAFLITTKNLRRYASAARVQRIKQKQIPTPVTSTPQPKITNSHPSTPSYRISAFKSSPKMSNTICKNTKDIRLPFEGLK